MIQKLLILFIAAAVGGCTDWETSSVATSDIVEKENVFTARDVKLSASGFNADRYTKIKELKVSVNKPTVFNPDPTVEAVEAKLQKEAQTLGATHIFDVRITDVGMSMLSYGTRKGFGVAAKAT